MKFMLVDIPKSDSRVVFGFDSYAMFTNKDLNSSVCQSQVMMAPSLVRAAQRCEFVDSRGGDEALFWCGYTNICGFPKTVRFPQQPWVFLLKMIILGCFGGATNFWKHPYLDM